MAIRWCGCAVALLALASPVWAEGVVIVLGGKARPYDLAGTAAGKALAVHKHSCRIVLLDDLINQREKIAEDDAAIVAVGTRAAVHLHHALGDKKLLTYCMVADPEALGLTQGRPAYGVTTDVPISEQFELIRQAVPRARSIGMLYRRDNPKSRKLEQMVRRGLPEKWQLHAVAIDNEPSVAAAIDRLLSQDVDVIWTGPDSSVYDIPTVKALLLASIRRNKPVFGFSPPFVRAGALLGVGIDPSEQGRQVADVTHSLLEDGKTGSGRDGKEQKSIPPVAPSFQVAVNLIVADKLGIRLPEAMVRKAAHVFGHEKEGTK